MRLILLLAFVLTAVASELTSGSGTERERALGKQLAQEIRNRESAFEQEEALMYVRRLVDRLAQHLSEPRVEPNVELIRGRSASEPIPLPGGYILVPATSFLAAQDESEFAGLMAHALAHLQLRHGLRQARQGEVLNLSQVPLIFLGGWTGIHPQPGAPPAVPSGFQEEVKRYELEADRLAGELIAKAGFNSRAYERYLARTLPADSLRLKRMAELLAGRQSSVPAATPEFAAAQSSVRAALPR